MSALDATLREKVAQAWREAWAAYFYNSDHDDEAAINAIANRLAQPIVAGDEGARSVLISHIGTNELTPTQMRVVTRAMLEFAALAQPQAIDAGEDAFRAGYGEGYSDSSHGNRRDDEAWAEYNETTRSTPADALSDGGGE